MKTDTGLVGSLATPFGTSTNQAITQSMLLEWTGCTLGILGALILALNVSWSGYGWIAFLISNLAWMRFAVLTKSKSIFVMQIAFTITTVIGIFRWLA